PRGRLSHRGTRQRAGTARSAIRGHLSAARRPRRQMTLLNRIVVEKRSLIIPLALALVVNAAVYALVVYPLETKAATVSDRATAAAQSLKAAERELAAARALVSGKSHADQELATFYDKVLPTDFAAAQRMTYAWVPAGARKTNVR